MYLLSRSSRRKAHGNVSSVKISKKKNSWEMFLCLVWFSVCFVEECREIAHGGQVERNQSTEAHTHRDWDKKRQRENSNPSVVHAAKQAEIFADSPIIVKLHQKIVNRFIFLDLFSSETKRMSENIGQLVLFSENTHCESQRLFAFLHFSCMFGCKVVDSSDLLISMFGWQRMTIQESVLQLELLFGTHVVKILIDGCLLWSVGGIFAEDAVYCSPGHLFQHLGFGGCRTLWMYDQGGTHGHYFKGKK